MKSLPVIAPEKPRFGEPCNGCGYCCAAEVCSLGMLVMPGAVAPCPALEFEGGRFWCGLVRNLNHYEPRITSDIAVYVSASFSSMLGIGKGCCADDPNQGGNQ